jgi:hypothetical protein
VRPCKSGFNFAREEREIGKCADVGWSTYIDGWGDGASEHNAFCESVEDHGVSLICFVLSETISAI